MWPLVVQQNGVLRGVIRRKRTRQGRHSLARAGLLCWMFREVPGVV